MKGRVISEAGILNRKDIFFIHHVKKTGINTPLNQVFMCGVISIIVFNIAKLTLC